MKENQTVTVVCEHCGHPHEVAVKKKFFFKEDWEYAEPRSGKSQDCSWEHNPFNLTREEWEACRVDITRDEFIQSILDRLSALETALAEKGGIK